MDPELCPICVETLDATDLATLLCDCNYKVCLWCYQRLCDEDGAAARCPNCRTLYDQERTKRQALDPKQCAPAGLRGPGPLLRGRGMHPGSVLCCSSCHPGRRAFGRWVVRRAACDACPCSLVLCRPVCHPQTRAPQAGGAGPAQGQARGQAQAADQQQVEA